MGQQQIDIKKTSDKWVILSIVIGLCLVAATPRGLIWQGLNSHYDPVETPLSLTKALLDAAAEPVNAMPPTTLSGDVRGIDSQCWRFLKTTLAKNNNQYQIEGRLLPDNGPTGADWV